MLNVSMPLAMFEWAIFQCGFSVSKFSEDFNINLLALNFLWSDVPLFSIPANFFLEMSLLLLTQEVLV